MPLQILGTGGQTRPWPAQVSGFMQACSGELPPRLSLEDRPGRLYSSGGRVRSERWGVRTKHHPEQGGTPESFRGAIYVDHNPFLYSSSARCRSTTSFVGG